MRNKIMKLAKNESGFVNKVTTRCGDKLQGMCDYAKGTLGDLKLSKDDLAFSKGMNPEDVTKLDMVEDFLKHFDTNEIAKKDPEVASTAWKTASVIAGIACPYAAIPAAVVNFLPDNVAAKVVEVSGIFTVSHMTRKGLGIINKKRAASKNDTAQIEYDTIYSDGFITENEECFIGIA